MQLHHVYRLFVVGSRKIVYVGRSVSPHKRKLILQRKHGLLFNVKVVKTFEDFEEACNFERSEIARLRPQFNQVVASSPGALGVPVNLGLVRSAETRARMSEAAKKRPGRVWTEESKAKVRAAFKGIPLSEAHRAKISAANKGRKMSDAHKKAWKSSLKRNQKQRGELQWPLKNLLHPRSQHQVTP